MTDFHPLAKRLLDGEVTLADLPPALRAEGEEALRLLAAVDRSPVALSAAVDARVMATVRRRAAAPSVWRWLNRPREVRVQLRPWMLGPALAAAAALALLITRPTSAPVVPQAVTVRFVLFAPDAQQVAVAGTFNQWDAGATPLVRAGTPGVWTATVTLPAGNHQYAFVVDGARWVPDPAAPAVDDGFGRRNSILAL
jgi:hypothetical protein